MLSVSFSQLLAWMQAAKPAWRKSRTFGQVSISCSIRTAERRLRESHCPQITVMSPTLSHQTEDGFTGDTLIEAVTKPISVTQHYPLYWTWSTRGAMELPVCRQEGGHHFSLCLPAHSPLPGPHQDLEPPRHSSCPLNCLLILTLPMTDSTVSCSAWLTYISDHQPDSSHLYSFYTNHQIPVLSQSFPSSICQFNSALYFFTCLKPVFSAFCATEPPHAPALPVVSSETQLWTIQRTFWELLFVRYLFLVLFVIKTDFA